MLIYIRLNLSLSEQQSEEVLLEMLDHLIDGQKEGKTAHDIFDDDPKRYADDIIHNLPKEKKREVIPFLLGIVLHLISWMLILRGVGILVTSPFRAVESTVYLFSSFIIFVVILASVSFGVWFIYGIIQQSLFHQAKNDMNNIAMVGGIGALSMGMVISVSMLIPSFGPTLDFTWWASLLTGGILWIIVTMLRRVNSGFR